MRTFKPGRGGKIKLNAKQKALVKRGILSEKVIRKEIGLLKAGAYDRAKLKASGLWDNTKKSTLKVRRISDMTPEERKELGL